MTELPENARAILTELWITEEAYLVSRLSSVLEMPWVTARDSLRLLADAGYVDCTESRIKGRFKGQFNGGGGSHSLLSNANLWSITETGKAKADALAAEKEQA